jgi:hypothetical protein
VRHGESFDFFLTWRSLKASPAEWRAFVATVKREVKASRALQDVLKNNYAAGHQKYDLIHSSIRMRRQRR